MLFEELPGIVNASLFDRNLHGKTLLRHIASSEDADVLREKIAPAWKLYTLVGKLSGGAKKYRLYIYHIGEGTIWLDDMKLVPVEKASGKEARP